MSTRPAISAEVLSAVMGAVPPRVSKRLDAAPRIADGWPWTFGEAITVSAGDETVSLAATGIFRAEDAACSCLLAPRCFHLVAVLTVLPLAEGTPPEARGEDNVAPSMEHRAPPGAQRGSPTPAEGTGTQHEDAALTLAERAIARDVGRLAATLLSDGLAKVSTVRLGELLRAVHTCRREGLFRLESATLGVYESVRDLRAKSPDFRLAEAASRLAEVLLVAYRLGEGHGSREWRGVGRRMYSPRVGLRLSGLACEPVLRRGYAGTVTYFTDGREVFSAHEVLPGDAARARDAYDAQLRFGETSLTHREASHGGLLFARAQVSSEGRLGAGREVTCVAAPHDPKLADALFTESLDDQLTKADRGDRQALVFLRGVIVGSSLHTTAGGIVPIVLPIDDAAFPFRENLARLAAARVAVKIVLRVAPTERGLLPVAAAITRQPGETWFSLGYDAISQVELEGAVTGSARATESALEAAAALDPLRRRVLRYALAGAASLPGAALPDVAREAKRLREALFATGAQGLEALTSAREPGDASHVWLGLHVYLTRVDRMLSRRGWAAP